MPEKNKLIIGAVAVLAAIVVAGYFLFVRSGPAAPGSGEVTRVEGGSLPGGESKSPISADRGLPILINEFRKRIEDAQMALSGAPEPKVPEKPAKEPEEQFPSAGQGKKAEGQKKEGAGPGYSVSPGGASAPGPIPDSKNLRQFLNSSGQVDKKALAEEFNKSYIAVLERVQDKLISEGQIKEEERVKFKNEAEITDFAKKILGYGVDRKFLVPEQKESFVKDGDVKIDLLDVTGHDPEKGSLIIPQAAIMAESIANRLEFATTTNWTEEQIVNHFYPKFYLDKLAYYQDLMVGAGLIKLEERAPLKTRAQVQFVALKGIDFLASQNQITSEDKRKMIEAVTKILPEMQAKELQSLKSRIIQNSPSSQNEPGIGGQRDFASAQGVCKAKSTLSAKAKEKSLSSGVSGGLVGFFLGLRDILNPVFSVLPFYKAMAEIEFKQECYNDLMYEATQIWAFDQNPVGFFTVSECCICVKICGSCPYCSPCLRGCLVDTFPYNAIWDQATEICGYGP